MCGLPLLLIKQPTRTGGKAITEDGATQVVGLVLDTAGKQPGRLNPHRFAVLIHTLADRPVRAGQRLVGAGPAETTLFGGVQSAIVALRQGDRRVADNAVAQPVVVDLRNVYAPAEVRAKGFAYTSIGRP